MNKFLFAFLLILSCQFPGATNISDNVAGAPDIVDAGMDATDAVTDALPAEDVSQPKHQNVLLIGDSEVLYASWQVEKIRKPNETVFIDSKPGTTIGWWDSGHFHQEMTKYPDVDVIIVFLGTNNFNWSFLQPHQNIIDEIKARHAKCLWVGPTNVSMKGWKNLHKTGPLIKEAVSGTCTYVDTEALDISLADGVHPTASGTIKWLTAIWKVKDE